MNPLDFTGPDFLVFYALYGAIICGGLWLLRLTAEPQMPTQAVPADPQTIAYLRGGATEALRISAMTLLERDVLVLDPNDTLRAHAHHKLPADASMIDRAVRDHFRGGASALSLFKDGSLALRAQAHAARPLEDAGLMPDDALRDARRRRLIAAVVAPGRRQRVRARAHGTDLRAETRTAHVLTGPQPHRQASPEPKSADHRARARVPGRYL
jgi:hypothetical protein